MPGELYLIPNSLGNNDPLAFLPKAVIDLIPTLKFFIVENIRNARRYLKSIDKTIDIDSITFYELNKHTDSSEIHTFLNPLMKGENCGILSEAGVPGVADPGAEVVRLAHQKGIRVVPLIGPSSILMAMMASGQNGQSFRFLGYLPVKGNERSRELRNIESRAIKENESQIFIETPYRNNQMFQDIMNSCQPSTLLTVAVDLTTETESVITMPVSGWKKKKPELNKRPAVFIIGK